MTDTAMHLAMLQVQLRLLVTSRRECHELKNGLLEAMTKMGMSLPVESKESVFIRSRMFPMSVKATPEPIARFKLGSRESKSLQKAISKYVTIDLEQHCWVRTP